MSRATQGSGSADDPQPGTAHSDPYLMETCPYLFSMQEIQYYQRQVALLNPEAHGTIHSSREKCCFILLRNIDDILRYTEGKRKEKHISTSPIQVHGSNKHFEKIYVNHPLHRLPSLFPITVLLINVPAFHPPISLHLQTTTALSIPHKPNYHCLGICTSLYSETLISLPSLLFKGYS